VTQPGYGPGWHAYLEALADHLTQPGAPRDRDAWARRLRELAPAYEERFAAIGIGGGGD
jgi:hypothetical protein